MVRRRETLLALLTPPASIIFDYLFVTCRSLTSRVRNVVGFDMHDRCPCREVVHFISMSKLGLLDVLNATQLCTIKSTHDSTTTRIRMCLKGLIRAISIIPATKGKTLRDIWIDTHDTRAEHRKGTALKHRISIENGKKAQTKVTSEVTNFHTLESNDWGTFTMVLFRLLSPQGESYRVTRLVHQGKFTFWYLKNVWNTLQAE